MAPSNNPPSSANPATSSQADGSSSVIKILHYLVVGLLLLGGLTYWLLKPPSLNPMADAQAAEAMALVQTHKAQWAPTLRQALTDRVQALVARGQGVRLGEWRVERERGDVYLVRVFLREEGTKQWFERDYVWRVDLGTKSVVALTLPAADLMPVELGTRSP